MFIGEMPNAYGRFYDVLSAGLAPGDVGGVLLGEDLNDLVLDDELAILGLYVALETSMCGIILEHVDLSKIRSRKTI